MRSFISPFSNVVLTSASNIECNIADLAFEHTWSIRSNLCDVLYFQNVWTKLQTVHYIISIMYTIWKLEWVHITIGSFHSFDLKPRATTAQIVTGSCFSLFLRIWIERHKERDCHRSHLSFVKLLSWLEKSSIFHFVY